MIIKPNEIKSSLIKAHMHFSVKNIFEKSKSIFTQSLNVFQSRFTKKLSIIQSTEIQSKCGPLELKGRTLLDKFSDVMKNKQNSIDMQEAEVEHVATSANVTQVNTYMSTYIFVYIYIYCNHQFFSAIVYADYYHLHIM
jgi:hypothetical protein